MEDKDLQEHLMELDLVKNHLREAHILLHKMAQRGAKMIDMKNYEKFNQFINNQEVNRKARDSISMALFVLKQEVVELFWKKEMNSDDTFGFEKPPIRTESKAQQDDGKGVAVAND